MIDNGIKVANGIVDALKREPLTLALVVINIGMLLLIFYIAKGSAETRRSELEHIFQNQAEMMRILSQCGGK